MKKILILGVVAVLLVIGLVLASCGINCPSWDEDCEVRTDSTGYAYIHDYCTNGDCDATALYNREGKSGSARCSCL